MPLTRKINDALILVVFVLTLFLSPETGLTARLAGEYEPVTTPPAQTPQKAARAKPETPVASSAAAPQPAVLPQKGEPTGVAPGTSAAQPAGRAVSSVPAGQGSPAGTAGSTGGLGRRSPSAPAGSVTSPSSPAPVQPAAKAAASQTPAPAIAAAPQLPPAAQKPAETAPPIAAAAVPQTPLQPPPALPPSAPPQSGRYVTIDFDNVDIQVFIKFVSELTGRNFVIDDKVRGKVTVISPKKIAVDEVYKVFESIMEIYGFAAVPAGDVIKVIPALDARGKNLELRLKREEAAAEDKVVTQILSLEHASPDEMKKVLDPLVSKNSIVLSYAPAGMLIITDVQSNINRLQGIVTALDVEGVGEVVSYIPLRMASATEVVKSLMAVFPPLPQRPGSALIRVVADERTNSVVLLTNETNTVNIKKLISLMDKEIPRFGTSLHVYHLQNSSSEDLVKVLMNLPKETKDPKAPATAAPTTGKTAAISKDFNVVSDKATNTLIITADPSDYRVIEAVIRQLDEPRPMVYIEALIMEVSVNKNFNIGVEWRGLKDIGNASLSGLGTNATGLGLAGFTGSSIIPQVNSAGTGIAMPAGLSLGVIGAGIAIGSVVFPNIGAVLQAYQNDSDVSILSTPQLLTLNNEDAEINVGKNVPYITRSDTSATATQVFGQSYEYKDVGITLKITPNINADQFVRLKIDQTVTKLADVTQTTTPTTLKRMAKTTVVIKDNETVVIGGMIDDSTSVQTTQVPCIGDIPFLEYLFKTKGRGREKTNLFVFITPHIVRNSAEAAAIYQKKIDDVGNVEEGIIKMNEKRTLQKPKTDRKD
jgi:general secretion pathway protein D